ncbi:Proline--tRNA ligase [uncultured archaeon]|nr:Proline--tRNA ligase [uncultured archaeon]
MEDKAKEKDKGITARKAEDFSEWYPQVLTRSGFIDYGEVSGTIVLRPSSYFAWQEIKKAVDAKFKKDGIEDAYFPLFIPDRLLMKEKEHMEGFNPEVAWVTEAGGAKFPERLAVRPTSETIMYVSFAKWIRSWRDLPLRYNQWNNVVRWEFKHPTPFIRTREFLWNEGHSVFATKEEAEKERDVILGIYERLLKDYLALPGIIGMKSDNEKFAGALSSFSIEHVMPDGFALQGPDFHLDGQNFAKAFDIKFLNKDGATEYAWQNTFAITTRELGVMVAMHGDDKGLVLPPRVAYVQIVIVPILKTDASAAVIEFAGKVEQRLSDKYRVRLDSREEYTPGFKFNEWEMKGVPLRIEVGPRDMAKGVVVCARRDTGAKEEVKLEDLETAVARLLDEVHESLYSKAKKFLDDSVHAVRDYPEFKKTLDEKKGIMHAPWCGDTKCELDIKAETGAKITNIPFDQGRLEGNCVRCGKQAKYMANFARSY